mmetsp:Transcript_15104/g.10583  ORF Transcript_15104/g.10583 Transcript_15104/m.10583 type:complete len:272 (+) Transcript_15104:168-983(+)
MPTTPPLTPSTLLVLPPSTATTSSLTTPLRNTRTFSVSRPTLRTSTTRPSTFLRTPTHPPLIGDNTVLSPVSRTKVPADHAGLSLPLVPWRVPTRSSLVSFSLFPSNSSLTAPDPTETRAVTVVGKMMPSNTPRELLLLLSLTTDTPEEMALASTSQEKSPLNLTPRSPATLPLNLRPLLTSSQLLSPLRLTEEFSRVTTVVSSLDLPAEPALTTLSLLLVTVKKTVSSTTLSRILGVPPGVTRVTSRSVLSLARVSAVSSNTPVTLKLTE